MSESLAPAIAAALQDARHGQRKLLDLSHIGLRVLPQEVATLTQLESLNLSGNQLTELPPFIGGLVSLKGLDLRDNSLSALPPQIGNLTALQALHVGGNELTHIPTEIGTLKQLRFLSLSGNRLEALPAEVGRLVKLQSLNASNNRLIEIPAEIGDLTCLNSFDVSDNQICSISKRIGELKSLETLNLARNQLEQLPPEIGLIAALRCLDLSGNKLRTLPIEISELRSLESGAFESPSTLGLRLEDNPLSPTYSDLTAGGQPIVTASIMGWLRSQSEAVAKNVPAPTAEGVPTKSGIFAEDVSFAVVQLGLIASICLSSVCFVARDHLGELFQTLPGSAGVEMVNTSIALGIVSACIYVVSIPILVADIVIARHKGTIEVLIFCGAKTLFIANQITKYIIKLIARAVGKALIVDFVLLAVVSHALSIRFHYFSISYVDILKNVVVSGAALFLLSAAATSVGAFRAVSRAQRPEKPREDDHKKNFFRKVWEFIFK